MVQSITMPPEDEGFGGIDSPNAQKVPRTMPSTNRSTFADGAEARVTINDAPSNGRKGESHDQPRVRVIKQGRRAMPSISQSPCAADAKKRSPQQPSRARVLCLAKKRNHRPGWPMAIHLTIWTHGIKLRPGGGELNMLRKQALQSDTASV